jgi:hypothetical protein
MGDFRFEGLNVLCKDRVVAEFRDHDYGREGPYVLDGENLAERIKNREAFLQEVQDEVNLMKRVHEMLEYIDKHGTNGVGLVFDYVAIRNSASEKRFPKDAIRRAFEPLPNLVTYHGDKGFQVRLMNGCVIQNLHIDPDDEEILIQKLKRFLSYDDVNRHSLAVELQMYFIDDLGLPKDCPK